MLNRGGNGKKSLNASKHGDRMRFHVVSLPHTHTTSDFSACAFTQKVIRFCQMMIGLGHEVILYAGEKNEAPATEHVVCIDDASRSSIVGNGHYTAANWSHPLWASFNAKVVSEIIPRAAPHDFICLIGGTSHKPISDALPDLMSVEFGIGYSGTFAKYRVFESYAWMHTVYGAQAIRAEMADGFWFDAVIPNQIDPALFSYRGKHRRENDYYLYAGRLIDRKGYAIAQEVCQRMGKRLVLAGPGEQTGYGEFVGEVGSAELGSLMAGAHALFAPTKYIEPFGTVTIEAMACGTPVICTDWGAFTETVEHGVDGFRCRTFAEFLKASEDVKRLDPRIIHRRAIKRFGMHAVADQYDAYFRRLSTLWGDGWYAI